MKEKHLTSFMSGCDSFGRQTNFNSAISGMRFEEKLARLDATKDARARSREFARQRELRIRREAISKALKIARRRLARGEHASIPLDNIRNHINWFQTSKNLVDEFIDSYYQMTVDDLKLPTGIQYTRNELYTKIFEIYHDHSA